MNYVIEVPGDRPVFFKDWQGVEAYLYLLEHSDWQAYLFSFVRECS